MSQVLTWVRYTYQERRAMTKYAVPGWQNTGGVTAALLAQEGFIGDTTLLTGEEGLWKFAGYDGWNPENLLKELGRDWCFFQKIVYKPYPCCRMFQTELDCFIKIINDNNISAGKSRESKSWGTPRSKRPLSPTGSF